MSYEVKVIADSLAPSGVRLTTLQVTFPRIVLAEMNTHRDFSRNSASSRAIPVEKMIKRVIEDPFIPIHWGKNQKGMQADEELTPSQQERAVSAWLVARDMAVDRAKTLTNMGIHKQITNRLLEPFLWHTAIISSTRWSNFYAQRCHPDAMPEIRRAAEMMRDAMDVTAPRKMALGEWHLPYIQSDEGDIPVNDLCRISVARCARVSYLTQEGHRVISEDLKLFDRLVNGMHWSPFEHVASACMNEFPSGNFHGWNQFRKAFAHECR